MDVRRHLVVSVVLVGALVQAGTGAIDVTGLSSSEPVKRTEAADDLARERLRIVSAAIDVLRKTRGPATIGDPRLAAITVLGTFRAPEGVDALVGLVDLRAELIILPRPTSRETIGVRYPATAALAAIGRPATTACLRELTKDAPEDHRARVCWVIGTAEGADVGRFLLEREIARAANTEGKARLQGSLLVFDKVFPPEAPKP